MKALKAAKPDLVIGVGGCVASQEGATIVSARALRGRRVRPADAAPPAGFDRPADAAPASPRSTSPSQRSRSSTTCRRPSVDGPSAFVSIMEGCSQVLQLLRGALHARRGSLPPVRGRAGRSGRPGRPGRARSHAAGPERQCLPRRAMGGTTEIADFALLIEYVAEIPGIERIRYTTSHPKEFTSRLVEPYARCRQAGEPPPPAGAARLGPHPDGDEARLQRAGVQEHYSPPADDPADHVDVVRLHRRLPRRDRCRLRES